MVEDGGLMINTLWKMAVRSDFFPWEGDFQGTQGTGMKDSYSVNKGSLGFGREDYELNRPGRKNRKIR
jgi:hypothetical protein